MLNNITNFFNLIATKKVKTQLDATDLLAIGTKDPRFTGNYQPTLIEYSNFVSGLVGGSNGQVLFNDNDTIAGASNLYWDKVNERVGIGTITPTTQMQIVGSSNTSILTLTSGTRNADIAVYGSGGLFEIGTQANYPLSFKTNSTGRIRIHGGGNVGINTATDAGYKLDVNGTARVSGNVTIMSANTLSLNQSALNGFVSGGSNFLQIYNRNIIVGTICSNGFESGFGWRIGYGLPYNATPPNLSALLDLTSTTKGFLPPRMTSAERTAILTPVVGLMVYQTDATEGLYIYKSTGWALNS